MKSYFIFCFIYFVTNLNFSQTQCFFFKCRPEPITKASNKTVIISTLLSHMRLIAFEPGLFIANVKFLQVVARMTIEIVYVLHNARNYLVLVVAWVFPQRISFFFGKARGGPDQVSSLHQLNPVQFDSI